jgi:mannitol-1-/sugar-/sorbitol-6-phosphatase
VRDVDAVLFDMDGTLVDSDAVVDRVWRAFCAEFHIDLDALLSVAHGVPAGTTIRRFLPDLSEREAIALTARQLAFETADLDGVVATPGAHELLARLDHIGLPWAIVTSADTRLATARLGAAGIALPSVLVTTDDIVAGKPDPEGYLAAAIRLGVDPARTLVVEDSDAGIAAGRAAGARVAALKGLPGDITIGALTELATLFASSGGAGAMAT